MDLNLNKVLYKPSEYFQKIGTYSAGGVNSIGNSSLKKLYPTESLKPCLDLTDATVNKSRNLESLVISGLEENRTGKINDKTLQEMNKIRNSFLNILDYSSPYNLLLTYNPKLKEHLETLMPVLNYITEDAKTAGRTELRDSLLFLEKQLKEARSKGFSNFPIFPPYIDGRDNEEEKNIIKKSQQEVLKFSINQALINLAAAEGSLVNSKVFNEESLDKKSAEQNLIQLGNKIFGRGEIFNGKQIKEAFSGLDSETKEIFQTEYEKLKNSGSAYIFTDAAREERRNEIMKLSTRKDFSNVRGNAQKLARETYTPGDLFKTLSLFGASTGLSLLLTNPPNLNSNELTIINPQEPREKKQLIIREPSSIRANTKKNIPPENKIENPRILVKDWDNYIYPKLSSVKVKAGDSLNKIILENYMIKDPRAEASKKEQSLGEYFTALRDKSSESQTLKTEKKINQVLKEISQKVIEHNLNTKNESVFYNPAQDLLNEGRNLSLPEQRINFQRAD